MSRYIDAEPLYEEIKRLEEMAQQRVIDTPSMIGTYGHDHSPAAIRYAAILNERTAFKHMLFDAPTADVAPARHGRWEPYADYWQWRCSECGFFVEVDIIDEITEKSFPNFCPNCGAKMDGGAE